MPDSSAIVSKVWNYAHVLKNAGVGYGDYIEQITSRLSLKPAADLPELSIASLIMNAVTLDKKAKSLFSVG